MRILYVAHEVNLGGATKCLLPLIDQMILKGNNVEVVIPKYDGLLIDELKKRNVVIYQIRFYPWTFSKSYCKTKSAKAKRFITKANAFFFSRKIKDRSIDLIHTNSSTVDFGLLLTKYTKIPHVYLFREFGYEDQNIVFYDSEKKVYENISKYSSIATFVSLCLMNKYKDHLSVECKTVYDGITADYLRPKITHRNKRVSFLIAGALVEKKGQMEALHAAKILLIDGCSDFNLVIAGKGNEIYEEELKKYVKENNLSQWVDFAGFVTNMIDLRDHSDVELVCSASEAFGRITIEAMMSGNVVIASNTGANPELVKDKENGFIYEKGNAEDLAQKMRFVIENRSRLNEMGIRAFEYAKNNFTDLINANNFYEIYQQLTGKV